MRKDKECQSGGNSRQNDKKSDGFLRRLSIFNFIVKTILYFSRLAIKPAIWPAPFVVFR